MALLPEMSSLHSRFGQGVDSFTGGVSNGMSGAAATHGASGQIDSLLGDLTASDEDQKRMNNKITMLKNDLDFNVALNKFIGKAGDNAKSLVGQ
ncbi:MULTISPECIES: HrpE family protein [Xanthomonas]|uniref:Serine kinase n=1 Tax=Xanthomonas arboricola TaxID=56448 RepID=A0AAU9HLE9_9XANT|nr:HrpE family protein [Xanthomonas arboricola]MBB6257248.1 type III secretion hrp pilus HrpE [Xanthomonas arboricola]MBB6572473.1 type III secretion hrp pilus HrpE [Xanthomonas arboricola]NIJ83175.1 type III secretion hrp pilus HrpE [Xanthomonas arboricola]NIK31530.1 type III secretion hrp pilus HrpE [Xanthomonas arboricola]NIK51558.1 type III secretion hrp pilus HrpE [Xanthomonas arboricola]